MIHKDRDNIGRKNGFFIKIESKMSLLDCKMLITFHS